jgi:hypothetical protein
MPVAPPHAVERAKVGAMMPPGQHGEPRPAASCPKKVAMAPLGRKSQAGGRRAGGVATFF